MKTGHPSYQKEIAEFEQIVGQLRGRLLLMARSYLHDASLAEDAVQETLMRCWIVRNRLGSPDELSAFATKTIQNYCIDQLRKGKSHSIAADAPAIDESPTADTLLVLKEQHDWMMECLRRLPVGARAAIQMKGIDGLSYGEMATILGTTEAAVRAKVAKARKQLWKLYQRRK
ncbi:MAG: sigma-70 family RNA polymerase sigma factor [Prevotella sp.]|nr:sigma-70 family RNA polymerase sigma factor [Prevotella sp.]